ncbi:hypothetical protein WP50_27130, partial [Lactiplantibacillus plantarum]
MAERIDGHTLLIGLMAYPIRHSMSPTMHNNAFAKLGLNYAYLAFEVTNETLPSAIESIRTLDISLTKLKSNCLIFALIFEMGQ